MQAIAAVIAAFLIAIGFLLGVAFRIIDKIIQKGPVK